MEIKTIAAIITSIAAIIGALAGIFRIFLGKRPAKPGVDLLDIRPKYRNSFYVTKSSISLLWYATFASTTDVIATIIGATIRLNSPLLRQVLLRNLREMSTGIYLADQKIKYKGEFFVIPKGTQWPITIEPKGYLKNVELVVAASFDREKIEDYDNFKRDVQKPLFEELKKGRFRLKLKCSNKKTFSFNCSSFAKTWES